MTTFGQALKRARGSRSQEWLAQQLKVSKDTVSRWELEKADPGLSSVVAATELLQMDPLDFMPSRATVIRIAEEEPPGYQRGLQENYRAVMKIHDLLLEARMDAEFNAMVVAVLRATFKGKKKRELIDQLERALRPASRGR